MPNHRLLTWLDVNSFLDLIEVRQSGHARYTGVYGVPRGGLVLAVMVSHRLGIPLLLSPATGCLVVDDIADSGQTLVGLASQKYSHQALDVMVFVRKTRCPLDLPCLIADQSDDWIVFPWEAE